MGSYQIALLGASDARRASVQSALRDRVRDLGLAPDALRFLSETDLSLRDPHLPMLGLFFGSQAVASDTVTVQRLLDDAVPIVPLVSDVLHTSDEIPPQLRHV